jgi:hypothetical protein
LIIHHLKLSDVDVMIKSLPEPKWCWCNDNSLPEPKSCWCNDNSSLEPKCYINIT